MGIRKFTIAIAAGLMFTGAATAQVFVIGSGLGGECYHSTQSRYSSFAEAERICTRALREEVMRSGNRAATYVNRGVMRMRNGRYDSAISDYARAISIKPEMGAAYLNQGAAHIHKRDFSDALAPLSKAIELNSIDLFAAYYNRAIAKENTGDVAGAYADFIKASELKPEWDLVEMQLSRFEVTEG